MQGNHDFTSKIEGRSITSQHLQNSIIIFGIHNLGNHGYRKGRSY